MATCFSVVRGKMMRVTRTDPCGAPFPPGTEAAVVTTKGFVTVSLTAVNLDGTDIESQNADGELCVNDRSRDQFRRWDVEVEFCNVDPSLLEMVTNATVEEDYDGNVVGIRQPEGASIDTFGLEVWAGVPGTDCLPGEPITYGYLLLPTVIGNTLGDITIENDASTFTISGYTKGGQWGVGPYDVVAVDSDNTPGPLAEPVGPTEHMILRTTTIAPPEAECGAQPMPEPAGN